MSKAHYSCRDFSSLFASLPGRFFHLTLETRDPTLPVCADIRGAAPSTAPSLQNVKMCEFDAQISNNTVTLARRHQQTCSNCVTLVIKDYQTLKWQRSNTKTPTRVATGIHNLFSSEFQISWYSKSSYICVQTLYNSIDKKIQSMRTNQKKQRWNQTLMFMKAQCLQGREKTTSTYLPCNTNSFIFWFDIFLIHTFIETIW